MNNNNIILRITPTDPGLYTPQFTGALYDNLLHAHRRSPMLFGLYGVGAGVYINVDGSTMIKDSYEPEKVRNRTDITVNARLESILDPKIESRILVGVIAGHLDLYANLFPDIKRAVVCAKQRTEPIWCAVDVILPVTDQLAIVGAVLVDHLIKHRKYRNKYKESK